MTADSIHSLMMILTVVAFIFGGIAFVTGGAVGILKLYHTSIEKKEKQIVAEHEKIEQERKQLEAEVEAKRAAARKALSGTLRPGNIKFTPILPPGLKWDTIKYDVIIRIGGNDLAESSEELKNGKIVTIIQGGLALYMWMKMENNQLQFSTTFESHDGSITGEIRNFEWVVNPNNYFQRNYDEHALEVTDKDGVTIFQIEYANEKFINITGFWRVGDVFITATNQHGMRVTPVAMYKTREDLLNQKRLIKEIFLYPSDLHLSTRVAGGK